METFLTLEEGGTAAASSPDGDDPHDWINDHEFDDTTDESRATSASPGHATIYIAYARPGSLDPALDFD